MEFLELRKLARYQDLQMSVHPTRRNRDSSPPDSVEVRIVDILGNLFDMKGNKVWSELTV